MIQVTKRNSNPNKPFEAGHSHGTFVQNRYAGEKGTHWDKTNKENYHFKRIRVKNDHRIKFSNLSNWKEEA